jgi:hypothetical protein
MKSAPINLPETPMSAFVQTPRPGVYADANGNPYRDAELLDGPALAAVVARHKGTKGLDVEACVRAGTVYVGKYRNPESPDGEVRYVVDVSVPDPYSFSGRTMWRKVYEGDSLAEAAKVMTKQKCRERRLEKVTTTNVFVGDERGNCCVENGYAHEILWQKKLDRKTNKIETHTITPEVQALLKK